MSSGILHEANGHAGNGASHGAATGAATGGHAGNGVAHGAANGGHAAHEAANGGQAAPAALATLRVGAVSYANTLPLVAGLDDPALQRAEGFSLELKPPRRLAEMLSDGALDVALIPVAEFLRGGYELLPINCIACIGPVRSVFLACEKPIGQCKRVLLDGASRSSNALLRVLLKHLWGVSPELIDPGAPTEAVPEPGKLPHGCDAALVIGDRALQALGKFPREEDLGAAWFELTNLPFVFAVWAVRPGVDLRDLPKLLCAARRKGKKVEEALARDRAEALGLPPALLIEYLTEFIRHRMGDRELAAIEMFYRLLRDMDLCPPVERLRFYRDMRAADDATAAATPVPTGC